MENENYYTKTLVSLFLEQEQNRNSADFLTHYEPGCSKVGWSILQ